MAIQAKKYVAEITTKRIATLEFLMQLSASGGNRHEPVYFDGTDVFVFAKHAPRDDERAGIHWKAVKV